MTRITAGLGATRTMGRATGAQDWRQPPASPRQTVDWNDPKFSTPQPSPKWAHKRHPSIPLGEVPQLPTRTIRVKAKPPATYYNDAGMPIPADQWQQVSISPGILKAIAVGDLEEDKSGQPAGQEQQPRRRRDAQPAQAE